MSGHSGAPWRGAGEAIPPVMPPASVQGGGESQLYSSLN